MSSKSKSKVINVAALSKEEEQLQARLAQIKQEKQNAEHEQMQKVGEVIKSFPAQISKILGRDVTLGEVASFVKTELRGAVGSLTNTNTGDRSRRLSPVERENLRQAMLDRALNLKAGKSAEQQSAIALRFKTSVATVGKYAPTTEEIANGKLSVETPATEPAATTTTEPAAPANAPATA